MGFEEMMKYATREESEAQILVFWDMNKFPVPLDFDPGLVRQCIKLLLESRDYFGDLSIAAYGVLSDVPRDILSKVYHSGIDINHVAKEDQWDSMCTISEVTGSIETFANIIAITEKRDGLPTLFRQCGFNLVQPFQCGDDFQTFLKEAAAAIPYVASLEEACCESAYWDCLACARDPPSQGFRYFINHLSSAEHIERTLERLALDQPRQMVPLPPLPPLPLPPLKRPFSELSVPSPHPEIFNYEDCVTAVFWDINKCPLPHQLEPHLTGPYIKRYLKNQGYCGPITITAVGRLNEVPKKVLRGVYYSGICLNYALDGARIIRDLIMDFTDLNPDPANIMVIASPDSGIYHYKPLPRFDYNFLRQPCLGECLVGTVLEGGDKDNCTETAGWVCTICHPYHLRKGYRALTRHLSSREHERKPLDFVPKEVRLSKRQPLTSPHHGGHESITVRT